MFQTSPFRSPPPDLLQGKLFDLVTNPTTNSVDTIQHFCYSYADALDINARDQRSRQRTALMLSVLHGQDFRVIEFLVSALDADINIEDVQKFTALHFCCGPFSSTSSWPNRALEICYFLICFGRNTKIDARSWDEFTPLALACFSGNVEMAKMLIALGADVQARCGKSSKTILELAEEEHTFDSEICEFLRLQFDDDDQDQDDNDHDQDEEEEEEDEYSPSPKRGLVFETEKMMMKKSKYYVAPAVAAAAPLPSNQPQKHQQQQMRYASPEAKRLAASVCEPVEKSTTVVDVVYSHQHNSSPSENKTNLQSSKIKRQAEEWLEQWKIENLEILKSMHHRQEFYLGERTTLAERRRKSNVISEVVSPSHKTENTFMKTAKLKSSVDEETTKATTTTATTRTNEKSKVAAGRKARTNMSAFRAILSIFLVEPDQEDGSSSECLYVSKENAVAAILTFLPRISPKSIVLNHVEKKASGRGKLRAEEVEEIVEVLSCTL
jgi:hypothetical protein